MFLHLSPCKQGEGRCCDVTSGYGQHLPPLHSTPPCTVPPSVKQVGGTHPTGMLSCLIIHCWTRRLSQWLQKSSFSQTHNIGNNANIGIRGFTTWKQKKNPVTKCYSWWGLNLGLWLNWIFLFYTVKPLMPILALLLFSSSLSKTLIQNRNNSFPCRTFTTV